MGFWSGSNYGINYGISADRPRVELRKRQKNGCADRNWVSLSDSPHSSCFVCGHSHGPASFGEPFCLFCAFAVLRENSGREVETAMANLEKLIRHNRR